MSDKKSNKKNSPKQMGRPPLILNWGQAEELAQIQCTGEEISRILGIDYSTLERQIKRKFRLTYAEWYKKHSAGGKASLRRNMFSMSETNATMAIWLSKQHLNMTDKVENIGDDNSRPIQVVFNKITKK